MKKFLLLIPIVALAGLGTYFTTIYPSTDAATIKPKPDLKLSPAAIFLSSEHDLRQIIRHGNPQSITALHTSLTAIENKIIEQQAHGYPIDKLQAMLHLYHQDSINIIQAFTPLLKQIQHYDQYEHSHKKSFQVALEQIGLYELKTAYSNMESLRMDYIKEPSDEKKMHYELQNTHLIQIIHDLYLDASLEKPLYRYINNHKSYLATIVQGYTAVKYDQINRLHTNGYAIKTGLDVLPNS